MTEHLQSKMKAMDLGSVRPAVKRTTRISPHSGWTSTHSGRISPNPHPLSITNHQNRPPAVHDCITLVPKPCDSPTFTIEECGATYQEPFSPINITDLSSSPQHFRRFGSRENGLEKSSSLDRLSVSPVSKEFVDEESGHVSPKSPLLSAMREAVDSLSQYQDFEVLEKIGAGFFAEVFKVGR